MNHHSIKSTRLRCEPTRTMYNVSRLNSALLASRCPVDDKLISRFRGSWSESGVFETQVFAYMKTFRFTGSPALYIECDVRMCHGRCPVTNSQTVSSSCYVNRTTSSRSISQRRLSLSQLVVYPL